MEANNQVTYRPNIKMAVIALVAVFLTFFLHEGTHYITGKLLGYDMWMNLNGSGLIEEQTYTEAWHSQLVSISGPLFTIIQGIVFFVIIRKSNNLYWYPFLYISAIMRIFASVMSAIAIPNDEARVSEWLGIGKMTIPIIVSSFLMYLVILISKKYKVSSKLNLFLFLIISLGITALVFTNQYFINLP